jgi:acylphosphatase
MDNRFSFTEFIDCIIEKSYQEIIHSAENETASVERISYGVKGCVKNRGDGSVQYIQKLKKFLFFMKSGVIPAGADPSDLGKYKKVAQKLVATGELNEKIMDIFPKQ